LAIVVLLVAAACGGGGGDTGAGDRTIIVASFDFSESRTLAELYAQALEGNGFPVSRAVAVASRELVEPALEQGAAHLVPEYIGSSLQFLNGGMGPVATDTAAAHQLLSQALAARGVTALEPAPAQDTNAVVVSKATADRLKLEKISDLQPVAGDLVFGGPPECPQRPFCLMGLQSTYGLSFKTFRALGPVGGPATVEALKNGDVDVALLLTTSPALTGEDMIQLVDDRHLQPAENVVPVVRTEVLQRHGPRLAEVVNRVSAQLDTASLIEMNRSVDIEGRPVEGVVRDWLAERGISG
jgi:osmoprotectant transport system substrate-binding protein